MRQQSGAVLIVSLLLLLVLTILGVAAMRNSTLEERMAGNMRDLQIAFNAAEAALHAGEEALRAPALPAFLPPGSDTGGYYQADTSLWKNDTFWSTADKAIAYAGKDDVFSDELFAPPAYYLEELPNVQSAGGSLEAGVAFDAGVYRVTARGTGLTDTSIVILQTVFAR